MRKFLFSTALLASVLTLAACRGDSSSAFENNTIAGDQSSNSSTTAGSQSADTTFVQEATTAGAKEIELGRLAESKASNSAVKEYGQMMVREHQQADMELKQAAAQANLSAPSAETTKIQSEKDQLSSKSGAEFDRAYIDMMVMDHQQVASTLQAKINGDGSAPIKEWASKALPHVQQHLDRAQQIKSSLN
jgi:putative membrane protein